MESGRSLVPCPTDSGQAGIPTSSTKQSTGVQEKAPGFI